MSERTPPTPGAGTGEILQLVSFKMNREFYAVDIMKIIEIVRWQEITPVPRMPDFVEGLMNLRGVVIPVIDLRKRFDLPATQTDHRTRILIVHVHRRVIGFIVEEVFEVFSIPREQLHNPPKVGMGVDSDFLDGVYNGPEGMILILSLQRLLTAGEREALGTIPTGLEPGGAESR